MYWVKTKHFFLGLVKWEAIGRGVGYCKGRKVTVGMRVRGNEK